MTTTAKTLSTIAAIVIVFLGIFIYVKFFFVFGEGVNHRGEMYMVFSKAQVQDQIAAGRFNNSRLQALYDRMPEGSFYLMIVD